MNKSNLWSLRLGFSSKQATEIDTLGLDNFLKKSFNSKVETQLPSFLDDEPKTIAELREMRQSIKNADADEQKKVIKKQIKNGSNLRKHLKLVL